MSFRWCRIHGVICAEYLPAIRRQAGALNPRVNTQSLRELFTPRRWALDRPSPFESVRVLDPSPDLEINAQALTAMRTLFPGFRDVQVVQQWGGYIDVTPDIVPYIGTVDALPGLTVATGFSGHGFGIGPAAGRLAADLAVGATPSVDPASFRVARFRDGSPIILGPEV